MKKLMIFLPCIAGTMTGCSLQATSDDFLSTAKQERFDVSADLVNENMFIAEKAGCRILFYEEDTTNEAEEIYNSTAKDRQKIAISVGTKQKSEHNFWGYHHYSIKTATIYFYATHIGNTMLYFNGPRHCEEYIERLAEKLGPLY